MFDMGWYIKMLIIALAAALSSATAPEPESVPTPAPTPVVVTASTNNYTNLPHTATTVRVSTVRLTHEVVAYSAADTGSAVLGRITSGTVVACSPAPNGWARCTDWGWVLAREVY